MGVPPGRPADQLHRRMARLLHASTSHPDFGCSREQLMAAMGLDPGNASDVRKFWRDIGALKAAGWHIDTIQREHNAYDFRLRVVDNRIRATFTDTQRAQLLRAAERAGLGQLYEDLDPTRADSTPQEGPEGLGTAQYAIRHRCLLSFTYRSAERVVDPYDVFFSGDTWYLRGREAGSALDFKVYRLSRASHMLPEAPGTAGPIPELPAPNRDPMRQVTTTPFEVIVETSPDDLPDAVTNLGVNGHREAGSGAHEGNVQLAVTVTNPEAFLGRMFEMDTRVRLVGPQAMRERARELLIALREAAR